MANTTQGLRGLTFESALSPSTRQVNRLDTLRETGEDPYVGEPELRFRDLLKNTGKEEELLDQMLSWRPSRNERMASQRSGFLATSPEEEIGLEASAAGFGDSRLDKYITHPAQLNDIEDTRAHLQSNFNIFSNSIAKMGTLAATTAADALIGLPAGLINFNRELFSGNITSGREAFNSIIDNPVSSYLQSINEKSEEIFRNYQTEEERNRPWWENMFTANFIGDTLIKNAGFTIGAVLGGKAAVGMLGNAMKANEARDAFKGLAAELGMSGKTASQVVEALASGKNTLTSKAAVNALMESAKKLKSAERALKLSGALLAGTGEARIEALNGVSEYEQQLKDIYGDLDMERAKSLMKLQDNMRRLGIDPTTQEGEEYFNSFKDQIDDKYNKLREQIAHDKITVGNTIFALNVPLLTFGDMVQWGKLMLGGYAVDRNLVKGIKKAAGSEVTRGLAKTPAEIAKATRYATEGTKFTQGLGKFGAATRNVFTEMQEEMNQSFFSATAKAKAMGTTTEFMERLYDPMAVHDTVSWLNAAEEGMRQSWLNKEDWVEGFAGGFMGFMGLPSLSVKVNEQTGKRTPSITMSGGIWDPIREQNEMYTRRNELVTALNNRLSSPEFLNYYYGKIGNQHFDSIKEEAVKSGDKGLYKKADHAQLINDAMMFANAGRLQDFIDIVDSFHSVSDQDIDEIKKLFANNSAIQSMTTAGVRGVVTENAKRMERQLDDYIKISDSIKTVYGNSIDDRTAAELTWQTAHLDEIETDLKDILSHPKTSSLLSMYKSENAETAKDKTDYELVSSGGYLTWLNNKKEDKKDTTDKSDLDEAIQDAKDAAYDMNERGRYIDNISALSSDPELVQRRAERIKKQQEELRRLSQLVNAVSTLSTTDKLSEFISAIDEIGDLPKETLADINKEAQRGNVLAKEYLEVRDIESSLEEQVRRIGEAEKATEEQIQQALKAWDYLKHNSDTAYDLLQQHKANDVAPEVSGPEGIKLLNKAVAAVVKKRNVFKRIKQRTPKQTNTGTQDKTESSPENSTKFKTTGNKLTSKVYDEIVKDLSTSTGKQQADSFVTGYMFKLDLGLTDLQYEGKQATGIIYFYYKGNEAFTPNGKGTVLPVAYDYMGNEISQDDLAKLQSSDGKTLTEYLYHSDMPMNAYIRRAINHPILADRWKKEFPIDVKDTRKKRVQTSDTTETEQGQRPGSKENPHKFFAPTFDAAIPGSASGAVADAVRALQVDSEIHFGIESEDGPIFLLAGPNNMKVGTLPRQGDDTDVYSGLEEFQELVRQEYAETSDRKNADGMWISEKYVNHVREKLDAGFETTDDNISVNKIPGFSGMKKPIVMFVSGNEKDGIKHYFSNPGVKESDLQRRPDAEPFKSGFLYLLVPSGKKYIPVMLYTQNVNKDTLDLSDPKVTAGGFGKRINDTLDKLIKALGAKREKERADGFERWALNTKNSDSNSLQRLMYFSSAGDASVQFYSRDRHPDSWNDVFEDEDIVMVINRHDAVTDENDYVPIKRGEASDIKQQIIDAIYGLEYQTDEGEIHYGPIAQINKSLFEEGVDLSDRVRELIDSDMLLTDVKSFDLTVPSFVMDYWSVKNNKFVRPGTTKVSKTTGKNEIKVKKTKTGTTKTAILFVSGKECQVRLDKTGLNDKIFKIGSGSWFSAHDIGKNAKDIKSIGLTTESFAKTIRALAIITDKYGNSTTGAGRIGNNVLLPKFSAGKDAGFIITPDGGKFMSASELASFKQELAKSKAENTTVRKEVERKRREIASDSAEKQEVSDDDLEQEITSFNTKKDEIEQIEKVHTIGQAIDLLRRKAPQYKSILDQMSKIPYYNDVLVELYNIVDPNNTKTVGKNRMKFREGEFTNSILVGRNSLGYHTLMHELVHAFTAAALRYDNNLRTEVRTLMQYFQDTVGHKKLMNAVGVDGLYAFENEDEFVAEFFSNPKLQQLAKETEAPKQEGKESKSIFARFVNFIANAFRSVIGRRSGTLYDAIEDKLHSVVDRQVELQESGKVIFKSQQEFMQAKTIATGSKVTGVAFAMQIGAPSMNIDVRYTDTYSGDRRTDIKELKSPTDEGAIAPEQLLKMAQILADGNEAVSYNWIKRLLSARDIYLFQNELTSSAIVGKCVGDIFVVTDAFPAGEDYMQLLRTASKSKLPMIIASSPENVNFYRNNGFNPVNSVEVNGKIFVSNAAFTSDDLAKLAGKYEIYAEVFDNTPEFKNLRREVYSDSDWAHMSAQEKIQARECLGL